MEYASKLWEQRPFRGAKIGWADCANFYEDLKALPKAPKQLVANLCTAAFDDPTALLNSSSLLGRVNLRSGTIVCLRSMKINDATVVFLILNPLNSPPTGKFLGVFTGEERKDRPVLRFTAKWHGFTDFVDLKYDAFAGLIFYRSRRFHKTGTYMTTIREVLDQKLLCKREQFKLS